MESTIYVLVDPRKREEYRYVGTTRRFSKRLSGHICDVKKPRRTSHKVHWIRKLLREGIRPVIIRIETVDSVLGYEREIYWIARFKEEGHKLTNSTDGGEGVKFTDEVRRKISEANKGENHPNYGKRGEGTPMFGKTHSKELKDKMSQAWMSENNPKYGKGEFLKGEKNSFYGKHHTDEAKRKISESRQGKSSAMKGKCHSEETKQELSRQAKLRMQSFPNPMQGKHHSDEAKLKMSEAAKKRPRRHHSEEAKEKIRQAKKNYWADKTGRSA